MAGLVALALRRVFRAVVNVVALLVADFQVAREKVLLVVFQAESRPPGSVLPSEGGLVVQVVGGAVGCEVA